MAVLAGMAGKMGLLGKLLLTGKLLTIVSMFGSFLLYALLRGPEFAAGLVLMILVHEMGHVVEIRRQGMKATAPVFIPLFGAAIFQRQHALDALKQAQIGIAGPVAGTLGATTALALYQATGASFLLYWAVIGFFVNLLNMIPIGMLDGGWVLAVVSKWSQAAGLVLFGIAIWIFGINLLFVLIILVLGWPAIEARFRNDKSSYYQSVPYSPRYAMGAAWLALTLYLLWGLLATSSMFSSYLVAGR